MTQAQGEKVMGKTPSKFSGCPECPVEQVNWDDCQEFVRKLSQKSGKTYRLWTEAEWEYAAAFDSAQAPGNGARQGGRCLFAYSAASRRRYRDVGAQEH